MRYFDTSAKQHHADEEQDLFPALLESMAGSDPVCLRELTAALTAEHRELEARWQDVRAVLERVIAGEHVLLDRIPSKRWCACINDTLSAKRANCCRWRPACSPMMNSRAIGRAMRARRGIGD